MSGKTRSLWGTVLKNLVESLKPRQIKGNFKGDDYHGNRYYEIAADPRRGKRYPKRWFVPPVDMRIDQENMPAEWDAWLRLRRDNAPSEDELKANLTMAVMKQDNADKIAIKEGKKIEQIETHTDMSDFPVYKDFETAPGEGSRKK